MIKKLVNLIFETLHLKQVKHEGVRMMGVRDPESVAEHSCNAAQIWYLLALMEWADANKVAAMLVWHDIWETRIGDVHKVGARYRKNKHEVEMQVIQDQFEEIVWWDKIFALFEEYEHRTSKEWIIAKDADYLEQAFQAKVYVEQWYDAAQDRIDNVGKAIQTESAKQLWNEMSHTNSYDWWRATGLKKL